MDTDDAEEEKGNEQVGCGGWRVASLDKVFLGMREHPIDGGEKL